jgi:hypothetical protein
MDCRTCEPTLIDLVHSELATDAAREAHAHLATCASCRASFDTLVAATKLAAQLPMVEPPPALAGRVMAIAEANAREAAARQRVAAPRPTPWQALLDFVGRLATRPQVAMATIMVLIVAVGLWSLPRLRHEPAVADGVVVNPEPPEGEVAPSTGVEPAEPLDLKVDMRARRIRSKDGMSEPAVAVAPSAPVAESEPVAEHLAKNKRSADDPFDALDDVDLGESSRRAAEPGRGSATKPSKTSAVDAREFAPSPPPSDESVASARSTRARSADRAATDRVERLGRSAGLASELDEQPRAQAEGGSRQDDTSSARSGGAMIERKGEAQPAAAAPASAPAAKPAPVKREAPVADKATNTQAASSLATRLAAARALASENGCASALPSYRRIVSDAPTSSEAGNALIDMAQCRRKSGDLQVARGLLERATAVPAVATRARALLSELSSETAPAASPKPAAPR